MKWLAIINPISGRRKNRATLQHLLHELQPVVGTCKLTRYAGHAKELARAASDFDGIAVAGGDGTLFEALNGIELPRQHLAIIPVGTGNSLARDLALTSSMQGLEALRANISLCIDLLYVTFTTTDGSTQQSYAATTIGLGYPANVTHTGNRRFKHLRRWCYPVAATVESLATKPFPMYIGYHGNHSEWKTVTGLLINNTQHSGNFRVFPNAALDDGLFDVMESKAGWFGQNVHNLSVLSQTYWYTPVNLTRTKFLCIDLKQPQYLMLDGEIFPQVIHIDIQIAPHVLTCYRNGGT